MGLIACIRRALRGLVFYWLSYIAGGAAFAACNPGAQCKASDGLVTTAPAGGSFIPAGAGKPNAALAATADSTIQGLSLTVTAAADNTYAGYAAAGSTLDLSQATITGWGGLHADGAGGSIILDGGSIKTTDSALFLKGVNLPGGGASATLTNGVNLTSTGNAVAVMIDANGANSFTMTGGSITGLTLGGLLFGGGNATKTVNLTNVTINSGGSYGINGGGSGGANNVLNIIGGSITHAGTSASGAVHFTMGGNVLVDGAIVKNTGAGDGVSIGNNNAASSLVMQNQFEVQAHGQGAIGVNIQRNGKAELKDGTITTYGDNAAYGIWVVPNAQSAPLVAERVTVQTSGEDAHGIITYKGTSTLLDVDVKVNGRAYGIASIGSGTSIQMTNGSVNAAGANAQAVLASDRGNIVLDGVKIDSLNNTTSGAGVRVQSGGSAALKNKSVVITDGAFAPGLFFLGLATHNHVIAVDDSTVTAQDAMAVLANGGTNTLNVLNNSTLGGDRLVYAGNCQPGICGSVQASNLTFNASTNSQLFGHADVNALSKLTLNLNSNARWTLRPSVAGLMASSVSVLNLDSTVVFDNLNDPSKFQTLTVGAGVPGTTAVYNAGANARIEMNVRLDVGGAGTLTTDRLLINGDVTGTTLIDVKEVAGSPGGLTSPGGTYLASEGISVVQVSGNATENAFALAGGYITMASQPYMYTLYAYGPGSSNGPAAASQKLVGGMAHWDWRLQSAQSGGYSLLPAIVPQASSYLAAPNALFQAGLMDIGTLHRRLGELRQLADEPAKDRPREAFLRGYGGALAYRANGNSGAYRQDADMRYAAMQVGGNFWGADTSQYRVRAGLAGGHGSLSFAPRGVANSRRTRMDVWSVAPTFTWQHAGGGYVDALVASGGFKGGVATRLRGKTATLKGRSAAASVELGVVLPAGAFTLEPQMQLVYQRLSFDDTRDVDGFPVEPGRLAQWRVRVGGAVNTRLADTGSTRLQLRGTLHWVQTLNRRQKIWLGEDFDLGKPGTALQASLGIDAALAGGNTALYATLTRQQRVGGTGHQGWTANAGVRARF